MADRVLEQKKLIVQAENAGNTALAQTLRSMPQVPLTATRVLDVAKRLMTGNAKRPDFDVAMLHATLTSRLQGQDDVLDKLMDCLAREELEPVPDQDPDHVAARWGLGRWQVRGGEDHRGADDRHRADHPQHDRVPLRVVDVEDHRLAPGYVGSDSNQERPFDTLESNPHRVILLDEFEKADKAVQRLFLSAFDEGYIRNAHGKVLDFSKALVICTTNAAREAL